MLIELLNNTGDDRFVDVKVKFKRRRVTAHSSAYVEPHNPVEEIDKIEFTVS